MLKLIPCEITASGDKKPCIYEWKESASNDPTVLNNWYNQFKHKNFYWGIPTGPDNGVYALDVDCKEENGWQTIMDKGYQIPHTLSQRTNSGGGHFLFKWPSDDGFDYKQKVKFDTGLDTRSDGGFIVWYQQTIPTDYHLADMPEWLKQKVRSTKREIRSGEIVKVTKEFLDEFLTVCCNNIKAAEHGEGNNVLNEQSFLVGQYLYSGLDKDYAFSRLLAAAKLRGRSESESTATINSGLEGGSKVPALMLFTDLPTEKPAGAIDLAMFIMSGQTRYTPPRAVISDLFNKSALKRPVLYDGWSTRDVTITSGDGGVGKSTMAIMESVCLRLGLPYLGFKCNHSGGKTVYLTAEDHDKKIIALAGSILTQMGYGTDYEKLNHFLDGFFVKLDPRIKLVTRAGDGSIIPNAAALSQIKEIIDDVKPDKLLLDPISYMWAFESQVNEMGDAVAQGMAELRDYGNIQVEALNHIGKTSSSQRDLTQFAGRGGTALVNRSRISRILVSVNEEDYRKYTGKELKGTDRAIMCNIAKFSDGSDEFNKPFIVRRSGYLFLREDVTQQFDQDFEDNYGEMNSAMQRIIDIVKYSRTQDEYPTEDFIISELVLGPKPVQKTKIKHYLTQLEHHGLTGLRLRKMRNPNPSKTGSVFVVIDEKDEEVLT